MKREDEFSMSNINTITIAGAGLSGASIVAIQARHIEKKWNDEIRPDNFPHTQIIIADPRSTKGPGEPYSKKTNIYLLNQPAYAMSPFIDDLGHFVDFLQDRNPNVSRYDLENSFQTRQTYGEYLHLMFRDACNTCEDQNFPFQIIEKSNIVTNADINQLGLTIHADGETWKSDSLIVADGHYKNEFLAPLEEYPYYFSSSLTDDDINTLPNTHNRILIVGSGQDMMDRLAELHHDDYKGQIDVISRRGVLPWVFDPELYHPDRDITPYKLKHFKLDNFSNASNYNDYFMLWAEEVKYAQNNGYGLGHVLGTFYSNEQIQDYSNTQTSNPAWLAMVSHIEAVYGNPTPQRRFDLLQSYRDAGRLSIRQGSINLDNIESLKQGFAVSVGRSQTQTYDAIINAANCARTLTDIFGRVRSPLIRNLNDKNLMSWDAEQSGILQAGRQADRRISYAGPYAHTGKWGCETFRGTNERTALEHLSI